MESCDTSLDSDVISYRETRALGERIAAKFFSFWIFVIQMQMIL